MRRIPSSFEWFDTILIYGCIVALVIGFFFAPGCGMLRKAPEPISVVEHIEASGTKFTEFEPIATFNRADLPAGVEASDVAAILTFTRPEEKAPDFQTLDIPSSERQPSEPKAKKPMIVVTKKGETFANEEAKGMLAVNPEKPKPSYAWVWWLILIVVLIVAAGWGVNKLSAVFAPAAKVVSWVAGIFKR